MGPKYDFSGWATKNDLLCSDGRTIRHGAFKDQDGAKVPLVWNHKHDQCNNVLGHAVLENRDEGVYAYCTFNDSEAGNNAKELVVHGDVTALSIYANKLKHSGSDVVHGIIREVSLVLAGANPGAFIDTVLAHSDSDGDDAVIYTPETIAIFHSEEEEEEINDTEDIDETEESNDEPETEEPLEHADGKEETKMADTEKTVQDVIDSMNDEQKTVMEFIVGKALENAGIKEEGDKEDMKHNVFQNDELNNNEVLAHAEEAIIGDAKRYGSMKESFLQHQADYGIDHIDYLVPEFKNVNGNTPGFIKRNPDAWVDRVMNGVHHTPFARIKMMFADLREDEARAKGYIKGKLKKEEVFGLLKRTVEPTTIYKKQKFDRDDIIDITDFDVIGWVKGEMRMMLDEEIARAILFGDGRSSLSEDKINPQNIIPICADAELYTIKKVVTPEQGETLAHAIINGAVKAQDQYEGSGNLVAFMAAGQVSDMLLLEDGDGRRMYKDMRELALAMGVDSIVKVPASIIPEGVYAVLVDLRDYNVGADKGGAINMFDDFDIDYNQQKYLIETRISGALTKPYSAIVLKNED